MLKKKRKKKKQLLKEINSIVYYGKYSLLFEITKFLIIYDNLEIFSPHSSF